MGFSQRECNVLLTADRAGGYGEPMARKLRIQCPGAIYHVMNRGDRQEPIFGDDRLLEQVSARPGPRHFGEAVQDASEAQAERLVVEGLKWLGWTEEVLRAKRKGDAGRVALARELRSWTTMPLAWIAERLWTGRRGSWPGCWAAGGRFRAPARRGRRCCLYDNLVALMADPCHPSLRRHNHT
jgi:hypothetical protein